MNFDIPTNDWWRQVEEGRFRGEEAPPWMAMLARAHADELAFRTDDAKRELKQANVPQGPWRLAAQLLDLRLNLRLSDGDQIASLCQRVEEFLDMIPMDADPIRARVLHLLGICCTRLNQFEPAEGALAQALQLIGECPSRIWILDTFGQVLVGQGSWEEARRTFRAVMEAKEKAGDRLGMAITAGNLGRTELQLGNATRAVEVVRDAYENCRDFLGMIPQIRLVTLLLESLLAAGMPHGHEQAALGTLIERAGPQTHYHLGFAWLVLARAAAATGFGEKVEPALARAGQYFSMPEHRAHLAYWRGRLDSREIRDGQWLSDMEKIFRQIGMVSEMEVQTYLLLAQLAREEGNQPEMRNYLQTAMQRAVGSNSRVLLEQVDAMYAEVDPRGLYEQVMTRFSGRPMADLRQTVREEASVVFADLVSFTPRAHQLSADEVMTTVRSLFELAVPLFSLHKVRPISYQGDGLLAAATGEDQRRRAVAFAVDLVRRCLRVSLIRKTLGETWDMQTRAGVASGPVVLGALGSHHKLDFAAIGLTTITAARLQTAANPSEVIVAESLPPGLAITGSAQNVELKGFSQPLPVVRIPISI